ncbi:MAG: RNA-binding domain-containing protein [Candidatus Bathyarchaeia archaeon]|jgi:predicted RNA binding protein with dsRBD fold (UPF0201 family)
MAEVRVTIKAHLNPTESQEKLEKAITNLFGDVKPQRSREHGTTYLVLNLSGKDSLRKLRQRIASDRIRDATRAILNRWAAKNEKVTFHLNRQAAYANHVSIYHANQAPLGPIEVEIEGPPEMIIEFLTGKGAS